MRLRSEPPRLTCVPPELHFYIGGHLAATEHLADLQRLIRITCFDPEIAPDPLFPTLFYLLNFGSTFWLVPGAEDTPPFSPRACSPQLCAFQGCFYAQAGALPYAWRRSWLLVFKHLYRPKAVVVPAQPTPFLDITGPVSTW